MVSNIIKISICKGFKNAMTVKQKREKKTTTTNTLEQSIIVIRNEIKVKNCIPTSLLINYFPHLTFSLTLYTITENVLNSILISCHV